MSLKIGNLDIQAIKVGSADCKVYIGNELLYPSGFTGKFKATYASGPDYTLDCDGETTLSTGNTRPSGYEYSAMTEAVIGNCVTSIGSSAFEGCRSLTSIYIPSGVTSIGGATFSGCTSLTAIDIPSGVTSIGTNTFRSCTSLTSVTVNATTPPSLGGSTFDNTNNCPIYVPAASVETYKAASGWSTYASRIQAIPTPSLTWVQFNSGDTINGLDIYGIRGVAYDIYSTFSLVSLAGSPIQFEFTRNRIDVNISNCYSETITPETNVEYVFSDIGCSDYYTCDWLQTASSTFELLIMQ